MAGSGRALKFSVFAAYALMCAIWGTTWLGIKVSLQYLPPFIGVGFRFLVAGLVMYAIAASAKRIPNAREMPCKLVFVLSLTLFSLNYILTYFGETHVSSGLTAVLFGVLPFFTFAFGHYLAGERTRPQTWGGAAIALVGVAAISLSSQLRGEAIYALAVIGASFVSAFGSVYAKRHSTHDPLATLPPAMLAAGIVVGSIGLLTEHLDPARAFSLPSIGALLYLAIPGSAIAFFLNLWLLQHVRVWIVSMSALIIPVVAVIVGVVAAHERIGYSEGAGAVLVVAGVWVALRADVTPAAERSAA